MPLVWFAFQHTYTPHVLEHSVNDRPLSSGKLHNDYRILICQTNQSYIATGCCGEELYWWWRL